MGVGVRRFDLIGAANPGSQTDAKKDGRAEAGNGGTKVRIKTNLIQSTTEYKPKIATWGGRCWKGTLV
jgi:hypothetical protein